MLPRHQSGDKPEAGVCAGAAGGLAGTSARGMATHEEKTRLIDAQRGLRCPETFAFLSFTRYCGWTRERQPYCEAQNKGHAIPQREVDPRKPGSKRSQWTAKARNHSRVASTLPHNEGIAYKPFYTTRRIGRLSDDGPDRDKCRKAEGITTFRNH
jgi:hypothetical protein